MKITTNTKSAWGTIGVYLILFLVGQAIVVAAIRISAIAEPSLVLGSYFYFEYLYLYVFLILSTFLHRHKQTYGRILQHSLCSNLLPIVIVYLFALDSDSLRFGWRSVAILFAAAYTATLLIGPLVAMSLNNRKKSGRLSD